MSVTSPEPRYRTVMADAVLLGAFTGLFGLVYLIVVEGLVHLIWGDDWATEGWFSGSLWTFVTPVVAGLGIGLVYEVFDIPARLPGFIEELHAGEVEPRTAPGAVGIAVISLISGPSLGPEAPLGTAGGAAGTWLARRRNGDHGTVRQMTFVGMSGAFGGLLSTPIGGPLLAYELEHEQTHDYYLTHLIPGVIAGAVSFGVMWPVIGAPFEGLLEIPRGDFRSWMLLAGVGLGVVAALAALIVGKTMVWLVDRMRPLDSRPVLRGLAGGVLVGAIAYVMPLTLFSGQHAIPVLLDGYQGIGVLALVAIALLKAAALGASLGGGFFGGPIFPIFFIGVALGLAIHILIPAIPLALALGGTMAALGAAVALLPLSMAVLTAIMIQSGLEVFGAVVLAAMTAYAIRIALTRRQQAGDMQRSAASEPV